MLARRDRLDALICEQAAEPAWAPVVGRLRCLRGIDTLTAVGLVAEIGDFAALAHPKQLASFVGLVPSEHSSGERRRQGAITKASSRHARRLLVEAAWHYRRLPALSGHASPPPARPARGDDRRRLARNSDCIAARQHLDAGRGKKRTTVATAVARELACFVWEIARQRD